ncbi:MAG: hypothetical protein A3E19_04705 [Planctomycetes bacterium RIFCSPHIGHO2_12_FULL_52_36]|nr:MAG: hypothetical protein A3E19_04705 [Planctomycetes bacterium RIFCSPHIGHO2_12_FULL_52_36]
MQFDALYLLKRLRCKVALSTVLAIHNGNIFYHQQALALTISFGHPADTYTFFSTNITPHLTFSRFMEIRRVLLDVPHISEILRFAQNDRDDQLSF